MNEQTMSNESALEIAADGNFDAESMQAATLYHPADAFNATDDQLVQLYARLNRALNIVQSNLQGEKFLSSGAPRKRVNEKNVELLDMQAFRISDAITQCQSRYDTIQTARQQAYMRKYRIESLERDYDRVISRLQSMIQDVENAKAQSLAIAEKHMAQYPGQTSRNLVQIAANMNRGLISSLANAPIDSIITDAAELSMED
jgi:hypothetical protein